jgi:GNAT superfamily N-acetyltransferase
LLVGAETAEGEPVGLLVADLESDFAGKTAEVISLFVTAKYRRNGAGGALLNKAEAFLCRDGYEGISLIYYAGKEITPVLEAFLRRRAWSPPTMQSKVFRMDFRIFKSQAQWLKRITIPQGMSIFLWKDMHPNDKISILKLEGRQYPRFLSPFKTDMAPEEANSLGLTVGDEVVGWCTTYRIAEDTILYDSLYVHERYQGLGCAFALLAQAIELQSRDITVPFAMFVVNAISTGMMRMVERRFADCASQISERLAVFKRIER